MDLYLKGKTAIVTGASQGIGKAIAMELAREGVKVFAVARNEKLLKKLRQEIEAFEGTVPVTLAQNLVEKDGPQKIAAAATAALGQVDILVNNAGRSQPVAAVGPEEPWIASTRLDFDCHRQLTEALLPDDCTQNRKYIKHHKHL